jgi:hypothetical protein
MMRLNQRQIVLLLIILLFDTIILVGMGMWISSAVIYTVIVRFTLAAGTLVLAYGLFRSS